MNTINARTQETITEITAINQIIGQFIRFK